MNAEALQATPSEEEQSQPTELNMNVFLKVKIKSLAAEARIIRAEEKKFNAVVERPMLQRGQPRIPRTVKWKASPEQLRIRAQLWEHRTKDVRGEARCSLIAYGYLRGRKYKWVEDKAKTPPNWENVQRIIEKFRPALKGSKTLKAELETWYKA